MDDLELAHLFTLDSLDSETSKAETVVFAPVPLEVRDVVLDPVFARRRDTLLRTVPVHEIVARAERVDSGIASFDIRAMVLAAFDAVIARQGFPDRTTPEQVTTLLSGIAAVQDPQAGQEAHGAAAEHVLDGLTNRRERERQFMVSSIVYAPGADSDVQAIAVPRPFWLLREAEDSHTGEVYLECSTDAVNALVGGLDLPIEDQQTALETVLERQLARGELDAAHATAIQARRLTAGYLIQIEELLTETERYLPGTDWQVAAPTLINAALAHITECLSRESRLLEHVAGGIAESSSPGMTTERRAKISTALTRLLGESRHLHTALMERLIGARGRFLDAQDSQMFRPVLSTVEFDLRADLLEPALALHVEGVEELAGAFLRAAFGAVSPVVLHWGDFVEALIHTPRVVVDDGSRTQEADLEFRPDPEPLVSREVLADARRILAQTPLPTRLSTLLAACPEENHLGASAGDLFVAASLRGFDNGVRDATQANDRWEDHLNDHASFSDDPNGTGQLGVTGGMAGPVHLLEVLGADAACVDDGTVLPGPSWSGNDLVVCVDRDQSDAILLGDISLPVPTPLRVPTRGRHQG